jgi:hypothetical protein
MAPVEVKPGVSPDVVVIECVPHASVLLTVLGGLGKPVEGATVSLALSPLGGPAERRQGTTDATGLCRQPLLPAGSATLRVVAPRFQPWERSIDLVPGQPWIEQVVLTPLLDAGPVRGKVLSDSGRYAQPIHVSLTPKDGGSGGMGLGSEVQWVERAGRMVGEFAFENLPPGTWTLIATKSDSYPCEPDRLELGPPRDDVVLHVQDAVAVADVVFELRDSEGLAAGLHMLQRYEGGERHFGFGRDGTILLRDVPISSEWTWRIDTPDYLPALGDSSVLPPAAQVEGRARRTMPVTLERGWGQHLFVLRREDRVPLAGVRILVDDQVVSATDARGRAFVRAAQKPKTLGVQLEGWRASRPIPLESHAGHTEAAYLVLMEPTPVKDR